jgi:hypothetical protein
VHAHDSGPCRRKRGVCSSDRCIASLAPVVYRLRHIVWSPHPRSPIEPSDHRALSLLSSTDRGRRVGHARIARLGLQMAVLPRPLSSTDSDHCRAPTEAARLVNTAGHPQVQLQAGPVWPLSLLSLLSAPLSCQDSVLIARPRWRRKLTDS